MKQFTFHNPTQIIFGQGTVQQVGSAIAGRGIGKVLLVAGGGSIKHNGVYDTVVASLQTAGVTWTETWGVRPNPTLNHVNRLIATAKQQQVEAILAVGGGSVIDTAKAVAAGVFVEDVWSFFEPTAIVKQALPIFTVLTISATASEMDPFAVVDNEEQHKKYGTMSPHFYPTVSIIDPSVQMSLPWKQTLSGALDALAHIMEFYFVGSVEETTLAIDEALIKTIIHVTNVLQENPRDYDARANLAWAATLALNGISGVGLRGGDWSTHSLEHVVSSFHPDVPHGMGLGVLFPAWILHMQPHNPAQFQRFARNIWNCDTVEQAVDKMKRQWQTWQAPTSLRELGVTQQELPTLADSVVSSRRLGALKPLTRADVLAIFERAF